MSEEGKVSRDLEQAAREYWFLAEEAPEGSPNEQTYQRLGDAVSSAESDLTDLRGEVERWKAEATRVDRLLHQCEESRRNTASYEDSLAGEVERLGGAIDSAANDLSDLSRLLPGDSQALALCERALAKLDGTGLQS